MKTIRFICVLMFCMAIALLALGISDKYARKELQAIALNKAEIETLRVKNYLEALFISSEWVGNSFIASFTDIERVVENNDTFYTHTLCSSEIEKLSSEDISRMLSSFISYNREFYSCVLIFEPGIIKDAPNGLAVGISSESMIPENLLDSYDIFNSPLYKSVANSNHKFQRLGQIKKNTEMAWTTGIPFYDETGKLAGQMWMDSSSEFLYKSIVSQQNNVDYFTMVVDDSLKIITSSKIDYCGKSLEFALEDTFPNNFPTSWYKTVQTKVLNNNYDYFFSEINGNTNLTYLLPLKSIKKKLIIIKSEERIETAVRKFGSVNLIVVVMSLLLLAICLLYVFLVFKKENDSNLQMKNELKIAADIQQHFLPLNPEQNTGHYRIFGLQNPAKSVGGDLYDFFEENGKLHFCIGDVSGKGVPAALQMTQICSLYRYISQREDNLSRLVADLNKTALESGDDTILCTFFAGIIDLESGLMQYCNAGHNPPVIVPDEGKAEFLDIKANMPICAFEGYDYKQGTVQLKAGDRIFLYTDGVTEARNSHKEFFGKNELLKAIERNRKKPVDKVVKVLGNTINLYSDNILYDDVSLLGIEYK